MFLLVPLLNSSYGSYSVAAIKDHPIIIQINEHLRSTLNKMHNFIGIHNSLKSVGNSNNRDIGSKPTSERSLNHCIRSVLCQRDDQSRKLSAHEKQTNCGCS